MTGCEHLIIEHISCSIGYLCSVPCVQLFIKLCVAISKIKKFLNKILKHIFAPNIFFLHDGKKILVENSTLEKAKFHGKGVNSME